MSLEFKSEEEFLKNYDSSIYEKLSMTADIAIFSVADEDIDNYRKLGDKKFSVLLVKRNDYPFKNKWCLPGGFIKMDENLETAAKRILKSETNLKDIYLEQLYTFSDVNRDPRMRIVSTSYLALIDKNQIKDKLNSNASWFYIDSIEEVEKGKQNQVKVILNNGEEQIEFVIGKKLRDFTTDRYEFNIVRNEKVAFDHPLVILSGIERIKNKLEYTDIVFNMMPELFTLGDLQQVYEVILNKKILAPDFRRMILKKVEKTDQVRTGKGHRPSALYKYKKKEEI